MTAAKPPLTPLRWIFAILGALVMLFCGGCSLAGVVAAIDPADSLERNLAPLFIIVGGIGFLFGLLIWWLAVKANRGSVIRED
jgi:hypothetical protein